MFVQYSSDLGNINQSLKDLTKAVSTLRPGKVISSSQSSPCSSGRSSPILAISGIVDIPDHCPDADPEGNMVGVINFSTLLL